MSSGNRRLRVLASHVLASKSNEDEKIKNQREQFNADLPIEALRNLLDGDDKEIKDQARSLIDSNPIFYHDESLIDRDLQELTLEQARVFAHAKLTSLKNLKENPSKVYSLFEIAGMFSGNLTIKLVVQWSLNGGTLLFLGTDRHEKYIKKCEQLELNTGFAMTEIGHGSNVRGLETTATYDHSTKEFVIHSPTFTSTKFWIGNAGVHGNLMSVFARLIHNGIDHGIHCFLVPIRDSNGKPMPGVTPEYCGRKMGLHGVDNGSISFNHVRIPKENLLNRFSDIDDNGNYISKVPGDSGKNGPSEKHFGATLTALVGGRIIIGCMALSAAKTGLAIATNFACSRVQFGPLGKESLIMSYPSTQIRLMPHIARAYCFDYALKHTTQVYKAEETKTTEIHALCAGFKATVSWFAVEALQACREVMGGQGYRAANRVSEIKNDTDIAVTFEGDNTVLMQQVCKVLYGKYFRQEKKRGSDDFKPTFSSILEHLNNDMPPKITVDKLDLPSSQLRIFEWRERLLLIKIANIMRGKGQEVFNANLGLALKVAHAHMDLEWVRVSQRICAQNPDLGILRQLYQLDTISRIQDDLGWFVAYGAIEPSAAQIIEDRKYELSAHLSQYALKLVEAFGVPNKSMPATFYEY